MADWQSVKLSEVLRHRKCNILIHNDEEYSLCRVQLHRRGVVLREKKKGSQIKTKKQQVCRAGDLVVAEMDAKFGGYGFITNHLDGAIVSSHYYLYELDKSKITREYFEILIKTDFIQNQIEAKGSTNYSSIRAWEFLDYEIPLQSIALQNIIAAKYLKHSRFKDDLWIELNAQLKYLSQLRQRILQEAIEGKLTAKWRNEHPELISGDNHASKLLEKIKAEKQTLTENAKYTKKDKPLAPIADTEKPFDLPDGWVWCRLGEIIVYSDNLDIQKYLEPTDKVNYVDIDSIDNQKYLIKEIKVKTASELSSRARRVLRPGYILYSTVRPYLNNLALIEESLPNFIGSTGFCVFKPLMIDMKLIKCILLSSYIKDLYLEMLKGFNSPSITNNQFESTPIPLQPLAEQQAIVELVDKLMTMIEELEKQVAERKEQAEMLMQSVLREAFAKG